MVNAARKYGVEFNTDNPSRELRGLLPLWHHFGEDTSKRQLNNKPQSKCLRENHKVETISEGLTVMDRLTDPDHHENKSCSCEACCDDRRERGCKNPHGCAVAVRTRLDELLPKWDPRTVEQVQLQPENEDTEESITFAPPESIRTLTDGFRVFTKTKAHLEVEAAAPAPILNPSDEDTVVVSTGGNTLKAGSAEAQAGIAVWYGQDDPRNREGKLPTNLEQSTKSAEITAALLAAQTNTADTPLHLESSRDVVLKALGRSLQGREDLVCSLPRSWCLALDLIT
ncbi:hypothetical protein C8R43DRAFT_887664 [Mycena crocata]|nr:hypothetical protein C8R43DRAFT_887664 [Mycena crocata]